MKASTHMRSIHLFAEPGVPEVRPRLDAELAGRVATLLRAGAYVFRVNGTKPDVLNPTRTIGRSTLTDGQWLWSEGDIYYVETYRLAPDPDFIEDCLGRDFEPRPPSPAEVAEIRAVLQGSRQ